MSHSFPLPDTEYLERLISGVYKAMPGPDRSRIMNIEERLSRKSGTRKPEWKLNEIPWWFVLLLTGGIVSATWWAGEQWFGERKPMPKESDKMYQTIEEPQSKLPAVQQGSEENDQTEESYDHRKSPVIYQREDY